MLDPKRAWHVRSLAGILVFTLLVSTACHEPGQASAVADQTARAARQLEQYYQSLIDASNVTWDLTAFDNSLKQIPFEDADRHLLQERISELQKRAELAHALATLAIQFQGLTSSKAPADTSAAVSKLGKSLSVIAPLPPNGPAITGLAALAAKEIVSEIQLKKSRESAAKIDSVVQAMHKIFTDEKPAYDSIARERATLTSVAYRDLVKANLANPYPALKSFADSAGLVLTNDAGTKVSKDPLRSAALALLDRHGYQLAESTVSASTAIDASLSSLHVALGQLASGEKVTLGDVQSWLDRAQLWLDQINKLRTTKSKEVPS